MSNAPNWLPEALRYSDFNGKWDKFLVAIYNIFENDFKHSTPDYNGYPVIHDNRIEDRKEAAFWHIISSIDSKTSQRLPDLRRCERIPWCKPVIENNSDPKISTWENKRKRETRLSLWLEELDYLIVLKQLSRVMVLVTAYCTDREHTRRKLRKERAEYLERQKPPTKAT